MKLNCHYATRDDRFRAFTGTCANAGTEGNRAAVLIVIILEVKDGKIHRPDWYDDNSTFY